MHESRVQASSRLQVLEKLISLEILLINLLFFYTFIRPPVTRVSDKVLIPQEEYPDINFVGLLIGPRGNTLKGI
jgi:hypothetical protein